MVSSCICLLKLSSHRKSTALVSYNKLCLQFCVNWAPAEHDHVIKPKAIDLMDLGINEIIFSRSTLSCVVMSIMCVSVAKEETQES